MDNVEKRFCKGCYADVTRNMMCKCGEFSLSKSQTYSEKELNEMEEEASIEHELYNPRID